jgi:peptidoglycan endopeptidase LytF
MDRKKTIVAAVMINAGILTVLFIAAMSMREEQEDPVVQKALGSSRSDPTPLFKEVVEIPPVMIAQAPPETVPFSLPPMDLAEEKAPEILAPPVAILPPAPPIDEIAVEKGDNLEKIAKKYQTSVDEIIKLNQLPNSFLKVGQRLKMPPQKSQMAPKIKSPPAPAGDTAEYYTMKVGDNPWSIAMKHHLKVDELLKMNGLNEKTARKLKPGDRLRIK